jgi:hypothetical protein
MDRINLPHLEIKEHHIVIKECTIKDQLQYFKQRDIKLHMIIKDMEAKHNNHSYDILGARMLWKPKEARILKNFIEF